MQELPRVVLEQCLAVNSYSDYLTFGLALKLMQDEMLQTLEIIDSTLTILELQGYDEHPEVGPLITETRRISGDTADCITTVSFIYGN